MIRYIKILLALLILGTLLFSADSFSAYLAPLTNLSWQGLLAVFSIITADRLLMTYKWTRLVGVHTTPPKLIAATKIYISSMLWGLFLPATVGADAIRIACFKLQGYSADTLLSSVLVERIFGFIITASMGVGGLLILQFFYVGSPMINQLIVALGIIGLVSVLIVALLLKLHRLPQGVRRLLDRHRHSKYGQFFLKVKIGFIAYRHQHRELAIFFFYTALEQCATIVFFWAIALDLGLDIKLFEMAIAVMAAVTLARIPITPAGLGIFEGAFVLCLGVFGVASSTALLIALLSRVLEIIAWSPWWLWYSFGSGELKPQLDPEGSTRTFN